MAAKLVAEEGILKGLVLPLEDGEQWVIGRDPDACQLLLEDPAASRKHLLCRKSPEGIILENLSKTNPVEVNNEELLSPRVLQNGDTVKIGSGMFRFSLDTSKSPETETSTSNTTTTTTESESGDSIFEENVNEDAKKKEGVEINFDLLETGRWLLKVIGGPNNGAEVSMQPNSSYIIGTDPNTCDIVFHDTSVSRQHAKISISDDETITIEDLKSRNGTLIDGQKIEERQTLNTNTIVTMGTTNFVVYDREGNMQTIISPLLPSIVKVLQKEDGETPKEEQGTEQGAEEAAATQLEKPAEKPAERHLGPFILIAIITGLFVLVGVGTTALFYSKPVVAEQLINVDKSLSDALSPFPGVKYSFNKATGRLLLVGHVLTPQDKLQLSYNLQGLNFVKNIEDSGIIIDEYVWQEADLLLAKNPSWKGVTVQSPSAGQFILTGYLQTRKQADQLYEYMAANFPYPDRLEKRVIVDEDVSSLISNKLEQAGIRNVTAQFNDGDLILKGGVAHDKELAFNKLTEEFKQIPGIRNVRSQVSQIAPELAMINISDKYEVSGFSRLGNSLSVIVNGRIITTGDILDGMTIKQITPGTIYLEREGVKYRIDYGK